MVVDSSSIKSGVNRGDSRSSRFRNLPSKTGSVSESPSQESSSVDVRQSLKDKGYVETYNADSEEFVYRSPEQEFISYQDKKLQQKGMYSSDVVVTDASGRIVREEKYSPGLVEAYGSTTIREAKLVEKNVYDYNKGEKTTETFDPTNRNTILASQQIVEGQIARGERTSEPTVVTQRREAEQLSNRVRESNQGYKRFQTTGGRQGAITGDTQIFSGSKKEREQYLNNPVAYNTKKRIQDAQKRSEELNNLGYTKASDIFNGKTTRKENTMVGNNDLYNFPSSILQSATGIQNNTLTNQSINSVSVSAINQEIQSQKEQKFLKDWEKSFEGRSEALNKRFQGKGGDDFISRVGSETLQFLSLQVFFEAGEGLTLYGYKSYLNEKSIIKQEKALGLNSFERALNVPKRSFVSTKELVFGFTKGFDITTPEGFVNVVTAPLAIKGFKAPKVVVAEDFLKSLNKETPSIRGDIYYGQELVESVRKGDVIRSTPELTVEVPKSSVVESRIVGTPKEVLTVASGKNINIISTPDGLQITTRKGTGKYADYFVRTETNIFGESISKTFRTVEIKSNFVDKITGFARGKNQYDLDYDLQLLKVTKTKAPQGIKFTEAVNVFDNTNELRLEGYTQRVRSQLEKRSGIPLSRKGLVPIGSELTNARELVQVGQKIPKTDFTFRDNVLNVDTYKTEFNIVDYPVATEKTFFRRTQEEAIGIKPVEFVTQAEVLLKRSFEIRFEKLGKIERPNVRVPRRIEQEPFFSKSNFYPTKTEEVFESFKGKQVDTFNINDASLSRQLEKSDPFGVSGDRLRNNLVEQTQRLDVQRPKVNYRLSDKTIYTNFGELSSLKSLRGLGLLKNPLSNTQPRIRNETVNMNKLDLFNESKLDLSSKSFLKNDLLINNRVVTENIVDNKLINDMRTLIKTESLLKTNTLIRTRLNLNQRSQARNLSMSDLQNPFNIDRRELDSNKNGVLVYDTYVRETRPKKGKAGKSTVREYKVGNDLPYNQALSEGLYYADNSQARSIRLVSQGRRKNVEDVPEASNLFKFRPNKTKGNLRPKFFVEKNEYLIDTEGERQEISVKGLLASRRKNRGMVF